MLAPLRLDIDEIIALESRFHANNYTGHQDNADIHHYVGQLPILIAAPHAVQHPRGLKTKKAEVMTGTLAIQLHQLTNCHSLTLSKANGEDPNRDQTGPFKAKLADIAQHHNLELVINLHGMSEHHPWDIVIGSAAKKLLGDKTEILIKTELALRQAGFNHILVDDAQLFAATFEYNLSQYSWHQLGIPSFQIEVNYHYRNPLRYPHKYEQLLNGFINAIHSIGNEL